MDGSCLEELDDHLEALVNADKVTTQRDCCRKVLSWLDDEQKKSELDSGTGNTRITQRPFFPYEISSCPRTGVSLP